MHTYPSKRSWWSSESMAAALNEVKSGVCPYRKQEESIMCRFRRKYNVPISTLHDHVTGRIKELKIKWKNPVLTVEKEKQLL